MASLFKRKGWYYLAFYSKHKSPDRRQVPLKTSSKKAADRLRVRLEDMWALGDYDPWVDTDWRPKGLQSIGLKDAVEMFVAAQGHSRPQTIQKYRSVLGQLLRHQGASTPLIQLNSSAVHDFLHDKPRRPVTRKTYSTTLGPFFGWAKRQEFIDVNPVRELRLETVPYKFPRYLTVAELDLLCGNIETSIARLPAAGINPLWLIPVVKTAVLTGMRIGELVNLKWDHVNRNLGTISVLQDSTFETKSRRDRVIPLSKDLLILFDNLPNTCEWVLSSCNGKKLFAQYVSRRFKHYCEQSDIDANFHTLRHTAASWLIEAGCSLESVRQLLGHSSIRVTERYVHLKENVFLNEIQSLQSLYLEKQRLKGLQPVR